MPSGRPTSISYALKALLAGLALGLAALFALSPWGAAWDHFVYDNAFVLRGPRPAPADLVIVAIDEPSFAALGLSWPWPRSVHGELLDRLFADGARVVALDIVFAQPSQPKSDQRLAQALARHAGVVLAADVNLIQDKAFAQEMVVGPWPGLLGPETGLGVVNLPVDADGFVRRVDTGRAGLPALSLAAAQRHAVAGGRELPPLPPEGLAGIDYLGPARTIKTVSYYQALLPGHLPAGFFKDKLVLVGVATTSTLDARRQAAEYFPVPFSRWGHGYLAGVEIHAQAAATWLEGAGLRVLSRRAALLLGLSLGALSCLLFFSLRPALGSLVWAGEMLLIPAAIYGLFVNEHLWVPPSFFILTMTAGFLVSPFLHYWRVWRERNFIRRAFATYLAPPVVQQLLSQPSRLKLTGDTLPATVLFSDLAGFTNMSERMKPQEVVEVMNRFLGRSAEIVLDRGGMVDKFVGDSVMALWGVPLPDPDQADKACLAALDMQALMDALNQEGLPGGAGELRLRIGINSGPVVAGNIGGERYFNYTVLGNEVNLASRLEGLNRLYGTGIMLSQRTMDLLGPGLVCRPLDLVRVKGQKTRWPCISFWAGRGLCPRSSQGSWNCTPRVWPATRTGSSLPPAAGGLRPWNWSPPTAPAGPWPAAAGNINKTPRRKNGTGYSPPPANRFKRGFAVPRAPGATGWELVV